MARIELRNVSKSYGGTLIIPDLSLSIEDGEFMVFVGPSGCGKSSMLRMLAGLEEISSGEIFFDDQCVNTVAPAQRGAAMVFQSYALYPHMTVRENIEFGLKMSKMPKADRQQLVNHAAEKLRLGELLQRYPKQLSGGQRQRVAIGRAIVRRPKVFLFDEPLSNLDAALRVQMRIELARLHSELKTTMIYVTHDQTEAMTLGNRIAVFNKGVIEQVGAPLDLYEAPVNTFVAQFLGSPRINLLSYVVENSADPALMLAGERVPLSRLNLSLDKAAQGVNLGVRPESLRFVEAAEADLHGVVEFTERLGDALNVYVRLSGSADQQIVTKLASPGNRIAVGDTIGLRIDSEHFLLFDSEGKTLIR